MIMTLYDCIGTVEHNVRNSHSGEVQVRFTPAKAQGAEARVESLTNLVWVVRLQRARDSFKLTSRQTRHPIVDATCA